MFFNVILPLLSIIVSVFVAVLSWRHRGLTGTKALLAMIVVGSLSEVGFIFEAITDTLPEKIFWDNIQYINQDILAITYFLFALEYTGYNRNFDYRLFFILLIEPIIDALLLWTSLGVGLVRPQTWLSGEPFSVLVCQYGLWDWISVGYIEVLIFISILLLIIRCNYSQGIFRRQCYAMIVGISLPFIGGLFFIANILGSDQYYLVYVLFGMGNSIVAYGLLKERLLEFFPVDVHTILDNLSDGIIILDNLNRITEINGSGEKILGVKKAKIIGVSFEDILQEAAVCLLPPTEGDTKELIVNRDDGAQKYCMTTTILQDGKNSRLGRVINLNDITEIHDKIAKLRKEASIDRLTGALNRNSYDEMFRREINKLGSDGALRSLILFDIDCFKDINDKYGHIVGDAVLRDVGAIVVNNIGENDLFGRWGGEEFVIFSQTSSGQAYEMAEKLRNLFQRHPFQLAQRVTASFGITQYRSADNIETLVGRADMAMYSAKRAGKNCTEIA